MLVALSKREMRASCGLGSCVPVGLRFSLIFCFFSKKSKQIEPLYETQWKNMPHV